MPAETTPRIASDNFISELPFFFYFSWYVPLGYICAYPKSRLGHVALFPLALYFIKKALKSICVYQSTLLTGRARKQISQRRQIAGCERVALYGDVWRHN